MVPSGMVHALELVRYLLKPGALLIDIHPSGEAPVLEVVNDTQRARVGRLEETDNFVEYLQAELSLAKVIENGWFEFESRQEFNFNIHASSLVEFQEFLAENWKDAIIPEETASKISALVVDPKDGGIKLIASELIYITRLSRI